MVYLEAAIQGFFLKIVIRCRYSSKAAGFAGVSQVFCYFIIYRVNGCFGGSTLGGCFIILSTLFILILHGRNIFWRALFAGGFLINNWYQGRMQGVATTANAAPRNG